jgi:hypothetical protein
VSFADWVNNGWLVAHKSSKQEIGNLLGIVARDLKDSQAKDVSDDWRFAIAYNAAFRVADNTLTTPEQCAFVSEMAIYRRTDWSVLPQCQRFHVNASIDSLWLWT